jgi:hypothetical protein
MLFKLYEYIVIYVHENHEKDSTNSFNDFVRFCEFSWSALYLWI